MQKSFTAYNNTGGVTRHLLFIRQISVWRTVVRIENWKLKIENFGISFGNDFSNIARVIAVKKTNPYRVILSETQWSRRIYAFILNYGYNRCEDLSTRFARSRWRGGTIAVNVNWHIHFALCTLHFAFLSGNSPKNRIFYTKKKVPKGTSLIR